MIVTPLKQFIVKSYDDVYSLYLEGELGVVEQRMPVVPKWVVGIDGTELDLINRLLDRDTDNLYNVVQVMDFYHITILGFTIDKTFNEPVSRYELRFFEDGKWESVYQIDNPTHAKDGTVYGDLEIYPET
jgi:hypothetical protein